MRAMFSSPTLCTQKLRHGLWVGRATEVGVVEPISDPQPEVDRYDITVAHVSVKHKFQKRDTWRG